MTSRKSEVTFAFKTWMEGLMFDLDRLAPEGISGEAWLTEVGQVLPGDILGMYREWVEAWG